jgi:energy-coupling factor transporter ATP-binding protein EcfA2
LFIRFVFQNHASFRDRTELSFAGTALQAPEGRRLPCRDLSYGVVRVLALYGANASGKSQAVRALAQMGKHITSSHTQLQPEQSLERFPFRLDQESRSAPTRFECDFVLEGVRYQYGFELTDSEFTEEWLFAWPRERKQVWFQRRRQDGPEWYFGPSLPGQKAVIADLTRSNSLFLSAAAQNNHKELGLIYRFFSEQLVRGFDVVNAGNIHRPVLFPNDGPLTAPQNHKRALTLLRAADLGICDLRVETQEELARRTLEGRFDQKTIAAMVRSMEHMGLHGVLLKHSGMEGHEEWFEPDLESRGTITLLNQLGPILTALERGGLLVIDELDASLHPRLCAELVSLFLEPAANAKGAQLVFTTHDETLLDVLHRDEVVFVDKDREGVSRLTPLTDYKTLKRDDIRRAYHLGRFGGVPRVGRLSQWLAEAEASEGG